MGNSTRLNLLLVTILGIFLMSFQKGVEGPSASVERTSYSSSYHSLSSTVAPVTEFRITGHQPSLDELIEQEVHKIKTPHTKCKKKVKRLQKTSTGSKLPIKYLERLSFYIFSRSTYTKPHFLSSLHRFLFRLTPF